MKRTLPLLLVAIVGLAAVILLTTGSDDRYKAKIVLRDAGGLRKGANVRLDGAPVGTVKDLVLDKNDHALATIALDDSVAPLGQGAHALIQADGFFGERFVELNRGDLSHKEPSGYTIPIDHSMVSPRLDDLVDSLDEDTRGALQSFFNEQGTALVGRGQDLADVLQALPSGLMETGELLRQFSADNAALGRLVDSSDKVVASVAAQRGQLGRMITAAAGTLDALNSRRPQLGQTVAEAPSTLQAARRVLLSLQDAAEPLGPAARGLRNTAPVLTQTLQELPSFAKAAIPAFNVAERVSPMLTRLGNQATPTVIKLRPLASTLNRYTKKGLGPFTDLLQKAGPDTIGVLEGWARSTQGYDKGSQIFRFGATTGTDTFASLLGGLPSDARKKSAPSKAPTTSTDAAPAATPGANPDLPKLPGLNLLPAGTFDKLQKLLDDTPKKTVQDLLKGKPVDALKNVLGGQKTDGTQAQNILDLLLKP